MTNRERWTVYPLLFMTLGITLTDKISKRVATDTMICKKLQVVDREQVPQLVLSATSAGGLIHSNGKYVQMRIGQIEQLSRSGIVFTDSQGTLLNPVLAVPWASVQQQTVVPAEPAEKPAEVEPPQPSEEAPAQP